jgi:hypothetical protein
MNFVAHGEEVSQSLGPRNMVMRVKFRIKLCQGEDQIAYADLSFHIEINETGKHVATHLPVSPFQHIVGFDYESVPIM